MVEGSMAEDSMAEDSMAEGRNRRYLPERYWSVGSFLVAIGFQTVEDCCQAGNFQMVTPQQVQPCWRGSRSASLEGSQRVVAPERVLALVFQSQQFEPRRHSWGPQPFHRYASPQVPFEAPKQPLTQSLVDHLAQVRSKYFLPAFLRHPVQLE